MRDAPPLSKKKTAESGRGFIPGLECQNGDLARNILVAASLRGRLKNCTRRKDGWTEVIPRHHTFEHLKQRAPEAIGERAWPRRRGTSQRMNSLNNIKAITKRELLAGYFSSPVAYVFIVIFLLLTGSFTFLLGGFFEYGQATLERSFFIWFPWLYLFLVPAAGMRLWAEERRVGTIELLLTLPITAAGRPFWENFWHRGAFLLPGAGSDFSCGHHGELPRRA